MSNEWLSDARKIPGEAMNYIRKIAVRAVVEKDYSPEIVTDVFGISRNCIYDWLNKYRKGGYDALDTNYAPGMEPIITKVMDVWLKIVVVSKDPTDFGYDTRLWTCEILAALLNEKFGIDIAGAAVNSHMKKMGLTYQKPRYLASEQDPVEVDHFLHDKFPRIQRLAKNIGADIAFEDESGANIGTHSGRTWGASGETPEIIAPDRRDKFNLLSIVTNEGEMQFAIRENNINSDGYIDFLEQLLNGRTQPLILIVDHAPFHKSKKVRDFVRCHRKKIRVYFLPRHAPEYNPDEQVWNEIKDKRVGRQPVKDKFDFKRRLNSSLESLQNNIERVKSFFLLPDTKYAS